MTIHLDINQVADNERERLVDLFFAAHQKSYTDEKAWGRNAFTAKLREYPVCFLALEAGDITGFAQTQCHDSNRIQMINIGSIGAVEKRKGIGKALLRSILAYCHDHGQRALLEIQACDLAMWEGMLGGLSKEIKKLEDSEEILETLDSVRNKPMKDQVRFGKGSGISYQRYSSWRKTWEERTLLLVWPGPPRKKEPIPGPIWPPVDKKLGRSIQQYMDRGESISLAGRSGVVLDLEKFFEENHRGTALSFSSGTVALQAAFTAADLKPGDHVLATVYSYHATVTPLLQFGVDLEFVDIEPDTGNICPMDLRNKIRPETRLLVTNHMWGHPLDIDGLSTVLRDKAPGCLWIEDCSHAHWSEYRGCRVGNFGDMAVFSLQANKMLPAGEGGILMVNEDVHHDRASAFAYSLARTRNELRTEFYRPLGRTGFGLKHRIHPLGAIIALHHGRNNLANWLQGRKDAHSHLQEVLEESSLFEPMVIRQTTSSMGAWYGYKPRLAPDAPPTPIVMAAIRELGLDISIPGSGRIDKLPLVQDKNLRCAVSPCPARLLNANSKFPGAETYLNGRLSFPTFYSGKEDPALKAFCSRLSKLEEIFSS